MITLRTARSILYTVAAFLSSCAALQSTHQVKLDHAQLREVLMDYHDDQILDNLIRAKNGLPIVHFDCSHVTAQVTSKFIPTVGGSRSVTDVTSRAPTHSRVTTDSTTTAPVGQTIASTVAKTVSIVGSFAETVVNPFNYGVSAERDNVVNVEVDPVLDDRTVYDAYTRFVNEGALMCAPDKPNPDSVLLGPKQWRDKQYYWVSTDNKGALYKLGLAVVARQPKQTKTAKDLEELNSLQRQDMLSR